MKASEKIKNYIKNAEGLRLNAYKCPRGVWTIGYGHTYAVKAGDVITKEQADKFFNTDIMIHENNVEKLVTVPLTQGQFDALVSFEYNIGYGAFKSSTLLRLLNQKQYKAAAEQFGRWVYCNGVILGGLKARRAYEKNTFLNG